MKSGTQSFHGWQLMLRSTEQPKRISLPYTHWAEQPTF